MSEVLLLNIREDFQQTLDEAVCKKDFPLISRATNRMLQMIDSSVAAWDRAASNLPRLVTDNVTEGKIV